MPARYNYETIRCIVCKGRTCQVNSTFPYDTLVQLCESCNTYHFPNRLPTLEKVLKLKPTGLTFTSTEYQQRRKTWIMCAYVTCSINVLGKRLILTLWEMGSRGCEHGCGQKSRLPCCICSDHRQNIEVCSPRYPDCRSSSYCEECKVYYENLPVHIEKRQLLTTSWD